MSKYIFYFFQILIMIWLLSLVKIGDQDTEEESPDVKIMNPTNNKWSFVIIHFIAWLFIFNHIIWYLRDAKTSKTTSNPENIIKELIIKYIDDNLNTLFGRTIAIFNFSTFNYLFPVGIIFEIIFGIIILCCSGLFSNNRITVNAKTRFHELSSKNFTYKYYGIVFFITQIIITTITLYYNFFTADSDNIVGIIITYVVVSLFMMLMAVIFKTWLIASIPIFLLFKYIFNSIETKKGLLKYILIALFLFYCLQIVFSGIWNSMKCDTIGNCNALKWILIGSNVLIVIASSIYFLREDFGNDECKCEKLFGLDIKSSPNKSPVSTINN
jgi:hypothetical protein